MDKDDIKFLASFAGAIILLIVSIIFAYEYVRKYQCSNYQDVTGRESKYLFMDSCYVKGDNDKWIRYDSAYKE